ncbi:MULTISPECIES: methyl coenzyme M reductase-arginine methyltransferase Mmp10 [Methanosphaera]|mgnify:FL=1|uniref:Predicted Fe-S oxidoreductase n=2 Tax=Methanosphaera stadtmanae TaxID=2317 RepID=Q2NI36_METST|nr:MULTISPECIES: methyl coenzyme M reductase-arginine methyltransferase Mmp10 [Methanosphaera]ABC56708.1 predicted Fe-S oxidoreductase [Methanosphaera stadtmanae DSM 3091]MDO5821572.1 methyl coenzyme M reductase-arginine methyltransferase Mmp10 [Methanosphaera sp.]MEE0489241.1 methyl coenzyme M reductase-arginine methyltransferase Mmp10 [Methanosphaera stadtmanae]OEC91847.1 methanogenesis marker radical SAM protein [Methanosphaera sp. A6]RAP03573.1 methanogenesis-associated radical SAM protein
MQIMADVGGIPGKNCRGFCEYCYFKKVTQKKVLGCKNCPPGQIGCPHCTTDTNMTRDYFPPYQVLSSLQTNIFQTRLPKDTLVNITGDGDVSCYPHLLELTKGIHDMGLPIHLGYTSGKGIDDVSTVDKLINNGVIETTYTAFSTDAKLREKWMHDPTADVSIQALKRFCESCDVHAASIIIPGVNDGDILAKTCADLESWGAKALILMRFANTANQGLILNNGPIIPGIKEQTLTEFENLVRETAKNYNLRVTGTPVCDPETDAPYALSKDKNKEYLEILTPVRAEATIVTSKISAPYIEKILENLNAADYVNVVSTSQEIACLITEHDLREIDLNEVKDTVIIPGRCYVHDLVAEKIFRSDGKFRLIHRGPDMLTADGEMSGTLSKNDVLKQELMAFEDLIELINYMGVHI